MVLTIYDYFSEESRVCMHWNCALGIKARQVGWIEVMGIPAGIMGLVSWAVIKVKWSDITPQHISIIEMPLLTEQKQ